MRKISTFVLAVLTCGVMAGQNKQLATPSQIGKIATYDQKADQLNRGLSDDRTPVSTNKAIMPPPAAPMTPAAMTVIDLGRASNAYTALRQEQNQVYASNALNLVAFIHRHDVTLHGGGQTANGKLRYDLSIDGGLTFTKNIGVLNNDYVRPARYPNMSGYNLTPNADPYQSHFVYLAPTLDNSPAWDGMVSGTSTVTNLTPVCTEHYDYLSSNTLLQGGLCEGIPGTYWAVDHQYNKTTSALVDSLYILKGTYLANDISWTRTAVFLPHEKTVQDGSGNAGTRMVGPNVSASPNGLDIWVGWLGDLIGGNDSAYTHNYIRSTDGGTTWSAPTAVDLTTIPWIADTLQSFWYAIDTISPGVYDTVPAGSGIATTGFDWDMTVDANGNPHFFSVIGNRPIGSAYSISSSLVMFAGDVTTTDGGATWTCNYISPVMTFRYEHGTPDPNDGSLLVLDNWCQVSRSEDGAKIFYSWTDTDTATTGFGNSDNSNPNLRVGGLRISDNGRTPVLRVSDGDAVFDGKIYAPTMAPTVLTLPGGQNYQMPIVFLNMLSNNQLASTQFEYIHSGPQGTFEEGDFGPVSIGSVNVPTGVILHNSFPNPTSGAATIRFDLPATMEVELNLYNLFGQKVTTLFSGRSEKGIHAVTVDGNSLNSGIYVYSLTANGKTYTQKMVIAH